MIRIVEVGPRDGLQNEKILVPTEEKVAFIDALSGAGLSEIEVTAFISPKWVPQLGDAEDVLAGIARRPGVVYSALVPNEQGLDRAMNASVDKIAVFTAVSETFNQKNINASIAESIARFIPVIKHARSVGLPIRGYISTAFWCPYEGKIAPSKVVDLARQLDDIGVDELSIGDTIGKADVNDVTELLAQLLPNFPATRMAMHFHDTHGHATENVVAAWRLGVVTFDASVGGLGGCPYAPGAPGNVATEAVVERLRREGAEVPVDLESLAAARRILAIGRTNSR